MSKNNANQYLEKLEFNEKLNHSWIAFFIDKKRFIWLLIFLIAILWYKWYQSLDLEANPDLQIWEAMITTNFPWASPESIEDLVTKKNEWKIAQVKWIKNISSTSMEWASTISVEFEASADIQKTLTDLKDKVDESRSLLPTNIERPIVEWMSFSDLPIWSFSISWEKYTNFELYQFAKKIKNEFWKNQYISSIEILWWEQKEFWVFIDPIKLETYNLTIDNVNNIISNSNSTSPIWDIKISWFKHSINIDSRYYSIEKLENIIVWKKWESWIIYLKDIAEVKESPKKITSISRISISWWKSLEAVTLSIKKKRWWSIVKLVSSWRDSLENMKKTWILPKDLNIETTLDESKTINNSFHHLVRDGILTILLVFITLFAIIWLKEALIAWTSVPLVLLVTFLAMSWYWLTLNSLSMFALILSLWLLVDDAIVVISAINQYKKTWKFTTRQAAILVVRDYKKVLTTTTLTVVFIFASMMFMWWMMWKFLFSIPFVMVTTLLASLIIAVTLNPALAVMLYWRDSKNKIIEEKYQKWWYLYFKKITNNWIISLHYVEKKYWEIISWLVAKTKRVKIFLFIIVLLFISSITLPALWILKIEFFEKWDKNNFTINIEAEAGSELEKTSNIVKQVEDMLVKNKEIKNFSTSIWIEWSHSANINVSLNENKTLTSSEIVENIRKEVKTIKNAKVNIVEASAWPWGWADFEIRVAWEDFKVLDKIGNDVKNIVEKIPWAVNVNTSRKSLPFEFNIILNKEKIALYNLSDSEVSSFIRNVVNWSEVITIYKWDQEIKVRTIYNNNSIDNLDKIKDLKIKNNDWKFISLRELIDLKFEPTVYSIQRKNQKRVISITAAASSLTSWVQIQNEFNKKIEKYNLPDGYEFITWWSNETSSESMDWLFTTMIYGLIAVIWLLILLYDSYKQAILVMITIPLSLIWVFYWLTIFNVSLSFPWMIWIVALFWIVIRNWIILFDQINSNLKEKIDFKESIIEAWMSRLEPVFLTSICTALWMLPLTISTPDRRALWLAIICWLITSTIFTLLALPSLYYMVFKKKYWVK